MNAELPALGTPERRWWQQGAKAEAQLRNSARDGLSGKSREVLEYLDALAKHDPEAIATPGALVTRVAYVWHSTLTRAEKRAIRRTLRGKRS